MNPDKGYRPTQTAYEKIYNANAGFVNSLLDHPPPAGYSNFLENVPLLEDSEIFQYFLIRCDNTKSTAQKHRDKGWEFYKADKVLCSEFKMDVDGSVMLIRADVAASFDRAGVTGKVKKDYPVHIGLDKFTGTILGGKCRCRAGHLGFCKHVAAVLFQVMDSQRQGLKFTPVVASKTSQLQTWHHPKVKGQALIKFSDMNFETFNYERDSDTNRVKRAKTEYKILSCPDGENCVSEERLSKFCNELQAQGLATQFTEILESNKCTPVHNIIDGNNVLQLLASGSVECNELPVQTHVQSFTDYSVTEEQHEFYIKNVQINSSLEQQQLSFRTLGQARNPEWKNQRSLRLTASNFKVVACRKKTPCEKFVKQLFQGSNFRSKHTDWGKQAEPLAIAHYKNQKETEGFIVSGKDLGLVVNPKFPYLGASPDWFVTLKKGSSVEHGLVEIKSLSKYASLTPREAANLPDTFFKFQDGKMAVDTTHAYYYQAQGQLSVAEVQWCDFVVWTPSGMEIQRIYRDTDFWNDILPILSRFYFEHMLPCLVAERQRQVSVDSTD